MNRSVIVIAIVALATISCSSTKGLTSNGFSNKIFSIDGVTNCKESHSGDAVDSQIGEIHCRNISFTYDYGKYGYRGPETPEESFRNAFDAYHHSKFFMLIHIDRKVSKIFKDSVEIIKILPKSDVDEKFLYQCGTCNAVAHLRFKRKDFYYPTSVNLDIFDQSYDDIIYEHREGQEIKLFSDQDGHRGAAISVLPSRRHRDHLSLSVSSTSLDEEEQSLILNSIRLHANQ